MEELGRTRRHSGELGRTRGNSADRPGEGCAELPSGGSECCGGYLGLMRLADVNVQLAERPNHEGILWGDRTIKKGRAMAFSGHTSSQAVQ